MSSYIGRTVAGKYRIVRKVGSGGMGSVYAAERVTTHELFALKFMNREFLTDTTYIERFKREIASLNAIRHPNVVNVFDWNLPAPLRKDQAEPA
jgi:serine/threonine protein kinase